MDLSKKILPFRDLMDVLIATIKHKKGARKVLDYNANVDFLLCFEIEAYTQESLTPSFTAILETFQNRSDYSVHKCT